MCLRLAEPAIAEAEIRENHAHRVVHEYSERPQRTGTNDAFPIAQVDGPPRVDGGGGPEGVVGSQEGAGAGAAG